MNGDKRQNRDRQNRDLAALILLLAGIVMVALTTVSLVFGGEGSPAGDDADEAPGWLDAEPPRIVVRDREVLGPDLLEVRVPVLHANRWVAVPVQVPSGDPEIEIEDDGARQRYVFEDLRIEIRSRQKHIEVDYDD